MPPRPEIPAAALERHPRTDPSLSRTHFTPTPFRPAWWLRNPHAQTVIGRYLRRARHVRYRRERIDTADGDFLDLDFALGADGPDPRAEALATLPLVVVLHGLEGNSQSGYVLQTVWALAEHGIRTVVLNFRSCSGEMNRGARFYHAGDTADLEWVQRLLSHRFPAAPLGAIGFSLGGNVLLKFLGECARNGAAPIAAAVAVSVPFNLLAGADALERGLSRIYNRHFVHSLQAKFRTRAADFAGLCDTARAARERSVRGFDDAVTAPLHGFAGAEDYYRQASSQRFLAEIRTPTLLLHSKDDPFLDAAAIPRAEVYHNPSLLGHFTDRGGHVGFVGGNVPWRPHFWAETEAARFLAAHLRSGGADSEPPNPQRG